MDSQELQDLAGVTLPVAHTLPKQDKEVVASSFKEAESKVGWEFALKSQEKAFGEV